MKLSATSAASSQSESQSRGEREVNKDISMIPVKPRSGSHVCSKQVDGKDILLVHRNGVMDIECAVVGWCMHAWPTYGG
jgi:hypothetical protein